MVHVDIRRLLTAKAHDLSQGSPRGIRVGQSDSVESCFSELISLPLPITTPPLFHAHSYIIQGMNTCAFETATKAINTYKCL